MGQWSDRPVCGLRRRGGGVFRARESWRGLWFALLLGLTLTGFSPTALPVLSRTYPAAALGLLVGIAVARTVGAWGAPWLRWRFPLLARVVGGAALAVLVVLQALFAGDLGWLAEGAGMGRGLPRLLAATSAAALSALVSWPGEQGVADKSDDAGVGDHAAAPCGVALVFGLACVLPTVWLVPLGAVEAAPAVVALWCWGALCSAVLGAVAFWQAGPGGLLADEPVSRRGAVAMGAVALGLLFFNSLARVVGVGALAVAGTPFGPFPIAAVAAVALLGGLQRVRVCRRWDGGAAPSSSGPDEGMARDEALAVRYGLSEREGDVLSRLLAGRTPAEIADEIGIKASTVRTYCSRLCKKTGHGSVRDLLCDPEFARAPGEPMTGEEPPVPVGEAPAAVARLVLAASLLSLLALLAVPAHQPSGVWGFGAPQAFGLGWALFLGGGAGFLTAGGPWYDRLRGSLSALAPHLRALAVGAVGALLAASAAAGVSAGVTPLSGAYVALGALRLVDALSQTVLFALVFAALAALGAAGSLSFRTLGGALAAATALLVVSRIGAAVWVAYVGASLLGAVGTASWLVLGMGPGPGRPQAGRPDAAGIQGPSTFLFAGAGLGAGFALEEAWRSLNAADVVPLTFPFVLLVVAAAATLGISARKEARWSTLALGGAMAVAVALCSAATSSIAPLVGFVLCAGVVALLWALGWAWPPSAAWGLCVGAGVAMLGAQYAVTLYGDLSSYNAVASEAFGGQEALRLATGFGFGLLEAASCLCLVALAWSLAGSMALRRLEGCRLKGRDIVDARVEAYLAARGLDDLERRVLLEIFRNKSGLMIARELGYSLGSVNRARDGGYRRLGIHSKAQLVECIIRGTGL